MTVIVNVIPSLVARIITLNNNDCGCGNVVANPLQSWMFDWLKEFVVELDSL